MELKDNGLVLSVQRFQESSGIVKVFSESHGFCSGFIKNINSKSNKSIFFPGNLISFVWNARLREHSGTIRAELIKAFSPLLMQNYIQLLAVSSIFSLVEILFHEQEHIDGLFSKLKKFLENLSLNNFNFKEYIEFELFLLNKAGYSLDLSKCAVTNKTESLKYLSPKSGKAVSYEIGKAYHNKLLRLPEFLISSGNFNIEKNDIIDALKITSYFFEKYIFLYTKADLLPPRENFIRYLIDNCDKTIP